MGGERTEAMREEARNVRESMRRDNLEEKLEGAVKERPGVRPFLELRPLLIAVAIAAVLTLIAVLIASLAVGAIVLVVSFAIAWVVVAHRSYDERRPTRDADGDEESDEDDERDSDPAPFSG